MEEVQTTKDDIKDVINVISDTNFKILIEGVEKNVNEPLIEQEIKENVNEPLIEQEIKENVNEVVIEQEPFNEIKEPSNEEKYDDKQSENETVEETDLEEDISEDSEEDDEGTDSEVLNIIVNNNITLIDIYNIFQSKYSEEELINIILNLLNKSKITRKQVGKTIKYSINETNTKSNYKFDELKHEYECIKTNNEFIEKESSILSDINFTDSRGPINWLIKGSIQSGKTKTIIGASYKTALQGISTIILVQDLEKDVEQLELRIKQYCEKYTNEVVDHNILNLNNPIIVRDRVKCKKQLRKALTGESINIIVCMLNESRMSVLLNCMDELQNYKYNLIVDEVDCIFTAGEFSKYIPLVETLRDECNLFIGITATIFDCALLKDNCSFTNTNTLIQKIPDNYKGLYSFKTCFINYTDKLLDTEVENVYTNLLKEKPSYPIIILHKQSDVNDVQFTLQDKFRKHSTLNKWTSIVYNGKGISLYSKLITSDTIKINNVTFKKNSEYIFELKNISIIEIMDYLKNNEIKFTHIVIFSGKLGNRGTSMVSSDNLWHLTHELLLLSDTCVARNSIQSLRLCGIYNDDIPLTLITTKKIYQKLKDAEALQHELIIESKKKSEQLLNKAIENIRFPKPYYPLKLTTKPKINLLYSYFKKFRYEGTECDSEDNEEERRVLTREETESKYYLITDNIRNTIYKDLCMDIIRIIKTKFRVGEWIKRSTIIRKIIEEYEEEYTSNLQMKYSTDIINICKGYSKNINNEKCKGLLITRNNLENKNKEILIKYNV